MWNKMMKQKAKTTSLYVVHYELNEVEEQSKSGAWSERVRGRDWKSEQARGLREKKTIITLLLYHDPSKQADV